MRSNPQHYSLIAPTSLAEVLRILGERPGEYTPIAGGTELMVALGAGRLASRKLLSIWNLPELRFFELEDRHLTIGAGSTFTDLRHHPIVAREFPLLAQAASWTGSIANQNRGTLGGNLANASPAADSPPALLVYDAEVTLRSAHGTRTLPYRDFHLGYKKTVLHPEELLFSLRLERRFTGSISYARKVGTRNAQAISKVALAALAWVQDGRIEEVRIAGASLRDVPARLSHVEERLTGRHLEPAVVAEARAALHQEIAPISDIRSTKEYRAAVAANLLEEFLQHLMQASAKH